jgi:hypothetical protein
MTFIDRKVRVEISDHCTVRAFNGTESIVFSVQYYPFLAHFKLVCMLPSIYYLRCEHLAHNLGLALYYDIIIFLNHYTHFLQVEQYVLPFSFSFQGTAS